MKYLKQLGIILIISFCSELLKELLPLSIPASIYGIILMLIALKTKIVRLDSVKETANFLLDIMPILFVPAGVGLLTSWKMIQTKLVSILVVVLSTTIIVMVVTGRVTQAVIKREKRKNNERSAK